MEIIVKPFVQMASRMKQPEVRLTPEQRQSVASDCRSRFWSRVVVPLLVAEIEFLKVWDEAEERKMIKFNQGVWLKATKGSFDKFRDWMDEGNAEIRNLIDDYGIQMYKMVKREMRSLYVTFCSYFTDKGLKDVSFKAQVQLSVVLISLARDLFDGFFDLYAERFGVDLREEYLAARVIDADTQFPKFAESVVRYTDNRLNPTAHYPCIKAYQEFCDKLLDDDTLDKAGIKALELNHEDEILAKHEWEKMGFGRLKGKYKVSKA